MTPERIKGLRRFINALACGKEQEYAPEDVYQNLQDIDAILKEYAALAVDKKEKGE